MPLCVHIYVICTPGTHKGTRTYALVRASIRNLYPWHAQRYTCNLKVSPFTSLLSVTQKHCSYVVARGVPVGTILETINVLFSTCAQAHQMPDVRGGQQPTRSSCHLRPASSQNFSNTGRKRGACRGRAYAATT